MTARPSTGTGTSLPVFVESLEMPFFYVPGNHDISNEVMADVWQERFGRAHYSFLYRGVLFVCLNTEFPESTRLSGPQLDWLEGRPRRTRRRPLDPGLHTQAALGVRRFRNERAAGYRLGPG